MIVYSLPFVLFKSKKKLFPILDNRRITDATKTVSELCQREVHNIRVCAECYHIWLNSPIYFTKVCSKPHLLVYVKLVDQPYWPAKVMQANANDKFVNVVYFGEHSQENVLATNCILYTDRLPGKMTKNMQVQKAKEVNIAKTHIIN